VNKRRGIQNKEKNDKLVNYKDLERNILNEIASEFHDSKKNSKENNNNKNKK
jgi:hypothetical protein